MFFMFTNMIIVMVAIISAMILWAMSFAKSGRPESNSVLSNFELDDYSPTLTQMIDFHRENGVVEYEL